MTKRDLRAEALQTLIEACEKAQGDKWGKDLKAKRASKHPGKSVAEIVKATVSAGAERSEGRDS